MAFLDTLINTFGGTWFDMKWTPTIDTPEWKKAIGFYIDLMKADGPPGASSNGFNENLTLMTSGKAAMWIDATVAGGMLENPKESQVAGKMGYAQSPIEATPNGSHWLWSWAFAIPKAAKQAEAAEKFAVWATSKDYIKLVESRPTTTLNTKRPPSLLLRSRRCRAPTRPILALSRSHTPEFSLWVSRNFNRSAPRWVRTFRERWLVKRVSIKC